MEKSFGHRDGTKLLADLPYHRSHILAGIIDLDGDDALLVLSFDTDRSFLADRLDHVAQHDRFAAIVDHRQIEQLRQVLPVLFAQPHDHGILLAAFAEECRPFPADRGLERVPDTRYVQD